MKIQVYDLEVAKNFFCAVFKSVDTNEVWVFEISIRKNQLQELLEFIKDKRLIGFNNINYDYPVLHWMIFNSEYYKSVKDLLYHIYLESQRIINTEYPAIRKKEILIPQLDLFRIWHFNNKAKTQSLKGLEIVMRMDNVQDLPFKYDEEIPVEYFDDVIKYCINDVDATFKFYEESRKEIDLRIDLSKEYKLDLYNANDPKIGEEILLSMLAKEMKIPKWDLRQMRSPASILIFKEYILDYIDFKTEPLQGLLTHLQSFTTTDTKGGFSYSARIGNMMVDYGQGGLHGCIEPGIYKSTNNKVILDIDVASYYPNLAIINGFRPKHLGDAFSKIYKRIYELRKTYPKSDSRNYGLKIALNGSFGKMNDEHSFLYDPESLLKITLNGQLLLSMLMEDIHLKHNITFLQGNTDGFTFICDKKDVDAIKVLVKAWEELTGLEMEYAYYNQMIIRDVNNYIAEYDNGKAKFKGCFEINRAWHKNHSMLIVPKALKEYYINDIPVEETISKSGNIYDFCKRYKSIGGTKLVSRNITGTHIDEEELSKNVRYFVSTTGVDLVKQIPRKEGENKLAKYRKNNPNQLDIFQLIDDVVVDKDKEEFLEAGYNCTVFNTFESKNIEDYNINFEYYINECYKIINVINGKF